MAVFLQLSELFDVILEQVLIKSMEFLLHPFLDKLMVVLRGFLYAILVVLNELLVKLPIVKLIREGLLIGGLPAHLVEVLN